MKEYMKIPFNDLLRLYALFDRQIERAVVDALRSGWWIKGGRAQSFSENFARSHGVRHCVPVANGTDALELALRAVISCPSQRGDKNEVIMTANAGGYATTAARAAGLIPVYADIHENTQLLSIDSALSCITEDTLAIVATHLYGGVVDVPEMRHKLACAGREDVLIIEDCAQSHGARIGGSAAGSLGDLSAFSFYPTKNLGAMGDAGAVLTSSSDLAAVIRQLQQYGWESKYVVGRSGGRNSRMDELQAAALDVILPQLPELNHERGRLLSAFELAASDHIRFLDRADGSVVHLAVVITDRRDELRVYLEARGISTEIHYPTLDCDQPGWKNLPMRIAPGGLPVSRRSVSRILSLPCFVGMKYDEIEHIRRALSEFR